MAINAHGKAEGCWNRLTNKTSPTPQASPGARRIAESLLNTSWNVITPLISFPVMRDNPASKQSESRVGTNRKHQMIIEYQAHHTLPQA